MAEDETDERRYVGTTRLEAFSDGVFAIAITLLVLDLAIPPEGTALERVVDAWPFYLAYVVSFLTIGAAWLAHTVITDGLARADSVLLRINLTLLLVVSVLPFPTRLVAEHIHEESDERVFVTMYGLVLLAMRVLLFALDEYARREHLYAPGRRPAVGGGKLRPAVVAYTVAILVGLALPTVAVGLYCAIAVYLIVPFRALRELLFRHTS